MALTTAEGAKILKAMYDAGMRRGEGWAAIVLFCITYSDSFSSADYKEVLEKAGISGNYATEYSLGRTLAKYVEVSQEFPVS